MNGTILDFSGSGMRLHAPLPAPCGETIEVDSNGSITIGRICRCVPAENGYEIGVQISHTVGTARDLEKLNRSLLGASRRTEPSRRY